MRDVELIACRLRRVEPLCRLTNSALQQLAMCGFYEDLEKGVTRKFTTQSFVNCNYTRFNYCSILFKVFRAGEQGRFWYAVLGGQLEVRYHAAADGDTKVRSNWGSYELKSLIFRRRWGFQFRRETLNQRKLLWFVCRLRSKWKSFS